MARKLEKIKVFTCSLTDKIYVGYLNKLQGFITNRVEVTDQVLTAVMEYMDNDETPFEITCAAGILKWIPNREFKEFEEEELTPLQPHYFW